MTKQEKILKIRNDKYQEQKGLCAYCGEAINVFQAHLAHILPQRKYLIKLYGEEIIHHSLNMKLTCPCDECNSGVQISPNKTMIVSEHVQSIMEAINEQF